MTTTLEDLWDELQRGRIYECSLRDPHWHLDGLNDGESVYIDPRPSVLETLIHELLHRRHPTWAERRVTRDAKALVGQMSEQDKARWWAAYRRVKRKRHPVNVED